MVLQEQSCLLILPLLVVGRDERTDNFQHIGMPNRQHFCLDHESALKKRLCLFVFFLPPVEDRQAIEALNNFEVLRSECLLSDRESAQEKRLCLFIVLKIVIE